MAKNSGQITNDILSALRGIRKESGFRSAPVCVTETPITFEQAGVFPALSVQMLRERVTYFPARRSRRAMRVLITGLVRPGAGADKLQAARDLMTDVEEALMADPTRGGAAILTQVIETRFDATAHEDGARASSVVEIVAHEEV